MTVPRTVRPAIAPLAGRARCVFDANLALYRTIDDRAAGPAPMDVLLFLAAEDHDGNGVTTSRCCGALPVPRTSVLRWIGKLVDAGLVEQLADSKDGRATLLRLTPAATAVLEPWLDAIA